MLARWPGLSRAGLALAALLHGDVLARRADPSPGQKAHAMLGSEALRRSVLEIVAAQEIGDVRPGGVV